MKPHKDLPKQAKEIFNSIVEHVETNASILPIDNLELSMLAMAYHQYFEAMRNGAKEGFLNIYSNDKGNTIQINGHQAQLNQAYANILKHSPKFGLNVADREKISAFTKTKAKPNIS